MRFLSHRRRNLLVTDFKFFSEALALFNTSMVTPTYYVMFTSATIVSSVILYQGFKATAVQIVTVVFGFLVVCCGITLLQLSKVDPIEISTAIGGQLDRKSTILLSAARAEIHEDGDVEKGLPTEDPGIDALRGGFGALGSIHRAMSSRRSMRREAGFDVHDIARRRRRTQDSFYGVGGAGEGSEHGMAELSRGVQLYDNPMPLDASDKVSLYSVGPNSPLPSSIGGGTRRGSENENATGRKSRAISFATTQDDRTHDHSSYGGNKGGLIAPPDSADITSSAFPRPIRDDAPNMTAAQREALYSDPFVETTYSDQRQTIPKINTLSSLFPSPTTTNFSMANDSLSPSSKARFNIPNFSRGSPSRPKGPADLDRMESRGLVYKGLDEDDDDEEEFGDSLERTETREL